MKQAFLLVGRDRQAVVAPAGHRTLIGDQTQRERANQLMIALFAESIEEPDVGSDLIGSRELRSTATDLVSQPSDQRIARRHAALQQRQSRQSSDDRTSVASAAAI